MPRVARSILVDYPLHVVQRGINRSACFFVDADYRAYLRYLTEFSDRFHCSVHAYCLMTNHVHLLLTPHTPDSCGLLMKNLGQCYVQKVNHRLGRSGTLWEGRFHSSPVTSDGYVLACYRYIELNPVRAGMSAVPEDYRWSSYCSNAHGRHDQLLRPHAAYERLGSEGEPRSSAYRTMCNAGIPSMVLEEIRKAARVGCPIGSIRRGRGRPPKAG
jgi:putative transposase